MKKTKNSYKKSGVNIETADKFTDYIRKSSRLAFKKKLNKVIKGLKKASKTHAQQAKTLSAIKMKKGGSVPDNVANPSLYAKAKAKAKAEAIGSINSSSIRLLSISIFACSTSEEPNKAGSGCNNSRYLQIAMLSVITVPSSNSSAGTLLEEDIFLYSSCLCSPSMMLIS